MAREEKWVTFDDDDEDEKLSLCDLPVAINDGKEDPNKREEESDSPEAAPVDFEFRTCGGGGHLLKGEESDMCAADEVFFRGQILPLRPSVSSDCGLLLPASRCGSRSDSMDRCSSAAASLGFTTSRSVSSGSRSSGCISRSHSSNSFSSACDAPRLSASNNFYAHPSPTPQVRHARRSSAGRRSTGSSPPGWGLLRLGVVKAPEIELYDLKSRRASSGVISRRSSHDSKQEKKAVGTDDGKRSTDCTRSCDGFQRDAKTEKRMMRFLGRGFGCRCSPDAVDPASGVLIARKKKEEQPSFKRGESTCRTRIFEWLEELSVTKASMG